jgi:hypothetical protein
MRREPARPRAGLDTADGHVTGTCADETSDRVWLAYVGGTEEALRAEARFSDDGGATLPAGNVVPVSAGLRGA